MFELLCVTNRGLCRGDFLEQMERLAAAHPAGIILREKDLPPLEYRKLAQSVMAVCARHGVPCILHSFVEVARELGHTSVHLPLPVLRSLSEAERAAFPILGASCHSAADAVEAEALGCHYITAGHVFDTACKAGTPGRGLDFLREVCASVLIPVYAIGGISAENVAAVRQAGAAGACVMSGAMTCRDPEAYFTTMKERANEI